MKKARITVHPSYRIGEISPRLFGAFLEPIGSMVNGSMYNPKHPTADEEGMRRDFSRRAERSEASRSPSARRQFRVRMAVEGFHRAHAGQESTSGSGMASVYSQ